MNADEAKREAIRVLGNRMRAWGVELPDAKARDFMDDLRLDGWLWMPPNNRPRPPKAGTHCTRCGKTPPACCDNPTTRPPRPATDAKHHADAARAAMREEQEA